jgi:hypothetical protein
MVSQLLDEVIYGLSIMGQDLQKDVMFSPDPVDFTSGISLNSEMNMASLPVLHFMRMYACIH